MKFMHEGTREHRFFSFFFFLSVLRRKHADVSDTPLFFLFWDNKSSNIGGNSKLKHEK